MELKPLNLNSQNSNFNFYDWAKNYTCKRVSKKKKVSLW